MANSDKLAKELNELINLMQEFEERNNISVVVHLCSDGSGHVEEFWKEELLFEGMLPELERFLSTTAYKKDPVDGLCYSPVQLEEPVAVSETPTQPAPGLKVSVMNLVNNYWKFDEDQQPSSSWHDKQELLKELEQLMKD